MNIEYDKALLNEAMEYIEHIEETPYIFDMRDFFILDVDDEGAGLEYDMTFNNIKSPPCGTAMCLAGTIMHLYANKYNELPGDADDPSTTALRCLRLRVNGIPYSSLDIKDHDYVPYMEAINKLESVFYMTWIETPEELRECLTKRGLL